MKYLYNYQNTVPKEIFKINKFHGGLNTDAHPKDLEESEITVATNVMVDKIGRVRVMGDGKPYSGASSVAPPGVQINGGYGLFSFSHDRKLPAYRLTLSNAFSVNDTLKVGSFIGNASDFTQTYAPPSSSPHPTVSAGVVYKIEEGNKYIISAHIVGGDDEDGDSHAWGIEDVIYIGGSLTTNSAYPNTGDDLGFTITVTAVESVGSPETGEDYILLANSIDSTYNIYDTSGNHWRRNIIKLGSSDANTPVKSSFYNVDGGVRISDGAFGSGNDNKWYGYIDRELFPTTSNASQVIDGWYSVNQKLSQPSRTSKWGEDIEDGGVTVADAQPFPPDVGDEINTDLIKFAADDEIITGLTVSDGDNLGRISLRVTAAASDSDYSTLNYKITVGQATSSDIFGTPILSQSVETSFNHSEGYYKDFTFNFEAGGLVINTISSTAGIRMELEDLGNGSSITDFKIEQAYVYVGTYASAHATHTTHLGDNNVLVEIKGASQSGASGWDKDWNVGVSFIYDENQESLIRVLNEASNISDEVLTISSGHAPRVKLNLKYSSDWNPRVTGINLYMREVTNTSTEDWFLQATFDLVKGVGKEYPNGTERLFYYDVHITEYYCQIDPSYMLTPNLTDSYRNLTGYDFDEKSVISKFKTAVVSGRTVYIGGIEVQNEDGTKKVMGDTMIKSSVNKFDMFPLSRIIEATVNDGDEIVKLEEYADRILQFKKRKMHMINISQDIEFLEDTFEHKGVSHPAATCRTDFGVAWVNSKGVYLYDGENVHNLFEKKGVRRISTSDWDTFTEGMTPMIGYVTDKRQLIIIRNIGYEEEDNNVYIYDIITQSWTYGPNKLFSPGQRYNITLSVRTLLDGVYDPNTEGGSVYGAGSYILGTLVRIDASPGPQATFEGWTNFATGEAMPTGGDGSSNSNSRIYYHQMGEADIHIVATFSRSSEIYVLERNTDYADIVDPVFSYYYNGTWSDDSDYLGTFGAIPHGGAFTANGASKGRAIYNAGGIDDYQTQFLNVNGWLGDTGDQGPDDYTGSTTDACGKFHFALPTNKWSTSPGYEYIDTLADNNGIEQDIKRSYKLCMLQPRYPTRNVNDPVMAPGVDDCDGYGASCETGIQYYDHVRDEWSSIYGVGYTILGGADQHGISSFTLTRQGYIMCFIPVLRGTGFTSSHNTFMYVMRSIDKVSLNRDSNVKLERESHMTRWVCTGRMGMPLSQLHGNGGFGEVTHHCEYPHIYKQQEVADRKASIAAFTQGFGAIYHGGFTNGYRKCLLMFRTEDDDTINPDTNLPIFDEWSNYSRWNLGNPWGTGTGLYGNGGNANAQTRGQLVIDEGDTINTSGHGADGIIGYKLLDYWNGSATRPDYNKGYEVLVHGASNRIGLCLTSGMDSDQSNPYTDLFYIQSDDGIVWKNINSTFTKDVFTGEAQIHSPNLTGAHRSGPPSGEGHPWITIEELSDPKNLMWLASSTKSVLDATEVTDAYSTIYPADGYSGWNYFPGNIAGKVAWEGTLLGGQGKSGGPYTPSNGDASYEPHMVAPGYGCFDTTGSVGNVHLYLQIYEKWGISSGYSGDGNHMLGDTPIITFDFINNCWKLLNDGRTNSTLTEYTNCNAFGRNYRVDGQAPNDVKAYGQLSFNVATYPYGPGMHDIWLTYFGKTTGTGKNDVGNSYDDGGTSGNGQLSVVERYRTLNNFATVEFLETVVDAADLPPSYHAAGAYVSMARIMLPYNLQDLTGAQDDGVDPVLQSYVHRFQGADDWSAEGNLYSKPARMWSTRYKKSSVGNVNREKLDIIKTAVGAKLSDLSSD